MRPVLLVVFCCLYFRAPAQLPGYAPFPLTLNAQKLAHALTDRYADDSSKVRSIYLWEARHIRYDVRSFQKGRSSYDTPKAILRHRRAVCLGYSILFDSLCYYAGVNSEMVPGFVREPWYEPRDTLFLDNHAWNVVQIDGEWRLLDVTWASGYVVPRRQVFRKILALVFRIPYRQHYRFVKHRNDTYFLTNETFFITQHFPSTVAWELLPCAVPVDSFQYSPGAVKKCLDSGMVVCVNGNDSIAKIEAEPKNRRQLAMGKQAAFTSAGNHQDISIGYVYYARTLYNDAENEGNDKPFRILMYDSTAHQLDSAAQFFNKAAADAKKELGFFLRRNKRLKQLVVDENHRFIDAHQLYRKSLQRESIVARRYASHLRLENKHLRTLNSKVNSRPLRIRRPAVPQPGDELKRKQIYDEIVKNNGIMDSLGKGLAQFAFTEHNAALLEYDSALAMERGLLFEIHGIQWNLVFLRAFWLQNNYDTIIMERKGLLYRLEARVDSLDSSVVHCGEWNIAEVNAAYHARIVAIDSLIELNMSYCEAMARMTESPIDEQLAYDQQKEYYSMWQDSLIGQNEQLEEAYRGYARSLHDLKRIHKVIVRRYHIEIGAEKARVRLTDSSFRHYFGGVAAIMKRNAHHCISWRAHCRYRSVMLKKEVATELRKEKAGEK